MLIDIFRFLLSYLEAYSLETSKMIGDFAEALLDFNPRYLKPHRFICNLLHTVFTTSLVENYVQKELQFFFFPLRFF